MAATSSLVLTGTHTLPDLWMPLVATTISAELPHSMPTCRPLPMAPSRWWAKRELRASSSA